MNCIEGARRLSERVSRNMLVVLLLLMWLGSSAYTGEVKYVYGSPRGLFFNDYGRAVGNMPWQILTLNDTKDSLQVRFSLEPRGPEPFGQMYCYSELELFLVADGGGYPTSYRAVSLRGQEVIADVAVEKDLNLVGQHLFTTGDSATVLRLYSRDALKGGNLQLEHILLSGAVDVAKLSRSDLSIQLGGSGPTYTNKSADVLALNLIDDSLFACRDSTVMIDFPQIPRGTVKTSSVHQYTLIAWHELMGVVLVVASTYESDWRELLILDRSTAKWSSVQVPGAQTVPRLINGLLAATVADVNSEATTESAILPPAAMRDEAVICNPVSGVVRTVELGPECEVLWLRGDTITYRTRWTLSEGVMDGFGNVEVLWSLNDLRVFDIHWAFWSPSESQ